LRLLEKGHIYQDKMALAYCSRCQRYLPDRYVEGGCPYCGFAPSRGDQCDKCGKPLGYSELVDPHCRLCGGKPETRESQHFFLRLSSFRDDDSKS
ncbi:MAG: class I tRNA ligase family protein, partial [Chloroflexi bacterium]|nr:class I tRNA ligase family protein [Chloroflexota bacterium]